MSCTSEPKQKKKDNHQAESNTLTSISEGNNVRSSSLTNTTTTTTNINSLKREGCSSPSPTSSLVSKCERSRQQPVRSNSLDNGLAQRRRQTFKRTDSGVSSDSSEQSLSPALQHHLHQARQPQHLNQSNLTKSTIQNMGERNCCSLASEEEEDEMIHTTCQYEHLGEDEDDDYGQSIRSHQQEALEAERKLYQRQYEHLNERNRASTRKLLYMEELAFELRAEQEKLLKKLSETETAHRRRVSIYQTELEILKEGLAQCEDRLAEARKREAERTLQNDQQSQEIAELKTQISSQELELSSLHMTRLELQRVEKAYQQVLDRIEALSLDKANTITALEQQHAEQRAARDEQIGALNERVAQLTHQLAQSIETIHELQQLKLCLTCKRLLTHCGGGDIIDEQNLSSADDSKTNVECTMLVAAGDDHLRQTSTQSISTTACMEDNNIAQSIVTASSFYSSIASSRGSSLHNSLESMDASNDSTVMNHTTKPSRLRRQMSLMSDSLSTGSTSNCDNEDCDFPSATFCDQTSVGIDQSVYPNGMSLKEEIDNNNNKLCLHAKDHVNGVGVGNPAVASTELAFADDCHRGNNTTGIAGTKNSDTQGSCDASLALNDCDTIDVCPESELFPSLPDTMLRKLCLVRDNPCSIENLSEEEIESKFHTLSLAFKTDKFTLDQRVRLYRHQRDVVESNVNNELVSLTEQLSELKRRLFGFDSKFLGSSSHTNLSQMRELKDLLDELEQQAKIIKVVARKISSRSELYGAVRQEEKLSAAFDVIMGHLDNLKRAKERDARELEEMKRLLNNDRNDSTVFANGSSGEPVNRRTIRSISTTMASKINLIRVRRASVASIEIPIDPIKEFNSRKLANNSNVMGNSTTTTTTTQTFRRPLIRQSTIDNLSSLISQANLAERYGTNESSATTPATSSFSSSKAVPSTNSLKNRRLSVPAADLMRNRSRIMQFLGVNGTSEMEITEEDFSAPVCKREQSLDEPGSGSLSVDGTSDDGKNARRLTITPAVQSEPPQFGDMPCECDENREDGDQVASDCKQCNDDYDQNIACERRLSLQENFYRQLVERLEPIEANQSAQRSMFLLAKRKAAERNGNRKKQFLYSGALWKEKRS